ncbi:MAG: septum formation initiator family protein [Candidatus Gribaldobacteria bacterium]|nr:septum formation initiator family protein [Candidatus Gribaldobacteria bacterium]
MDKLNKRFKTISVIIFIIVALLLGLLIYLNWGIFKRRMGLERELNSLKKEVGVLRERSKILGAQFSGDGLSSYLERLAREDLNLQKQGEQVIIFPLFVDATSSEKKENQDLNKKNLWQLIFGN